MASLNKVKICYCRHGYAVYGEYESGNPNYPYITRRLSKFYKTFANCELFGMMDLAI